MTFELGTLSRLPFAASPSTFSPRPAAGLTSFLSSLIGARHCSQLVACHGSCPSSGNGTHKRTPVLCLDDT